MHDKFCPGESECQCYLISLVRIDEVKKFTALVERFSKSDGLDFFNNTFGGLS